MEGGGGRPGWILYVGSAERDGVDRGLDGRRGGIRGGRRGISQGVPLRSTDIGPEGQPTVLQVGQLQLLYYFMVSKIYMAENKPLEA